MINCEECGKEFNKHAKICPHCGIENEKYWDELRTKNDYSNSYKKNTFNYHLKISDIVSIVLLALFGLYILLTIFNNSKEDKLNIWETMHLFFSLLSYLGIIIYSKNKNQLLYIFTGVFIILSMIFYAIFVDLSIYFELLKNSFDKIFVCLQCFVPQYLPTLLLYVLSKSNNNLEY